MTTDQIIKDMAALATAAAVVWGIFVYFSNSRLRRAEWLAKLYEKFYEAENLKDLRETLDCDTATSPKIDDLLEKESRKFTDYLNFFEFVAVLQKSGQLTHDEIEDLFGYYLNCLERCRGVRTYIADRGYEQLDRLLKERALRQ